MANKKAKPEKNLKPEKTTKTSSVNPRLDFWTKNRGTLIALGGLYLLILIFFAPAVFQGMGLTPAADMMAVAGMNKLGDDAISSFRFPLWNPTLFCGLPMFASLQYALFTYPPEFLIRIASYIFGFGDYRIWFFHYLLAGFFTYLLARHFGIGKIAAWIAGAAYAFSPQLIVLVDVGHGSKLMGMTYLPLIWLMIDRLRLRPSFGRAAVLGAVFAVEILALHPQIAAYGGMLMALYILYYGISAIVKGDLGNWLKTASLWIGAMILSLAVSAVLWMSVLDYARFSIRGASDSGIGGAGVSWEYATGWSFHPIESITYLFPSFFGFSGSTYWGTVGTPDGTPFTQNPMYFGIVILFLLVVSLAALRRNKWGFPVALGACAWVLSFGKYLPVLYSPMFLALPLFNKFRAPVMGQVLLLLPAAILAGMGFQYLLDTVRTGKAKKKLTKLFWWVAGITAGLAFLFLVSEGLFRSLYLTIAGMVRDNIDPRVLVPAERIARLDAVRVLFFASVLAGAAALALKRKIAWQVLAVVFLAVFIIDLWQIDRKLVNFTPPRQQKLLFQPEGVVKFLSRDSDKFRVHALDKGYPAIYWQRQLGISSNTNPANWLSYWGIESTTGYFGAKPGPFQKLMTASGLDANAPYSWHLLYNRPQLLDALNVRYILTTVPLTDIFSEIEKQTGREAARSVDDYRLEFMPREIRPGAGALIYRNMRELARVRTVSAYRVVQDFDATLSEMTRGQWNPAMEVLLDREPNPKPETGGVTTAQVLSYRAEAIDIQVNTSVPKLMVLADSYYPSGWTAYLDGEPVPILRADGVLRAVAVPEGDHRIEFRFKPKWFYAGLTISVASIVILLAWFGIWIAGRKKMEA